jgi:hypothetical protein
MTDSNQAWIQALAPVLTGGWRVEPLDGPALDALLARSERTLARLDRQSGGRVPRKQRPAAHLGVLLRVAGQTLELVAGTSTWPLGPFEGTYRRDGLVLAFECPSGAAPRGAVGPAEGLAVRRGGDGALEAARLVGPPLPEPPLEDWLGEIGESWLREEVVARGRGGSAWSAVLAAGSALRLAADSTEDPRERPDGRWAATWSASEREAVVRHAVSDADGLGLLLDDLEEALDELVADAEDAAGGELDDDYGVVGAIGAVASRVDPARVQQVRAQLLGASVARDELEGVAELLRLTRADRGLETELALADMAGRRLALALGEDPAPDALLGDQPRLRRVAERTPEAWWGEGYATREGAGVGDGEGAENDDD